MLNRGRLDVVQPPRVELIRVANLIDDAVGTYAAKSIGLDVDGYWEAPIEAFSLSKLCMRNAQAVAILARTDEVLAPAAWANARNAFEIGARILWLIHPGDRWEAEMRWIALVSEYERYFARLASLEHDDVRTRNRHNESLDAIRSFREGVEARVPDGYLPSIANPSMKQILDELESAALYSVYVEGSQYLHGSMVASSAFRQGLGTAKGLGDFTTIADWILPLRICWLTVRNVGVSVIDRLSDGRDRLDWLALQPQMDDAFGELARTVADS